MCIPSQLSDVLEPTKSTILYVLVVDQRFWISQLFELGFWHLVERIVDCYSPTYRYAFKMKEANDILPFPLNLRSSGTKCLI